MEQTLGKRIMENRKRLGLTQDALAEKLGVTAQAVSKWENDQSCPDITTLPKLADIFGISTDALLGRDTQPVYEAEVVDRKDDDSKKGTWEFYWDSGKKGSIFFAVFVILTGVLTILARSFRLDASFWSILWPSFLLCLGIHQLSKKFAFFGIISTLIGGYFLVDNLGIWELDLSNELIFPGIVVLFGISLLIDALKKSKKPKFHISRNGVKLCDENGKDRETSTFSCDEQNFECSHAFGENTQYVAVSCLHYGEIDCSFGQLTVDFSGCTSLSEDCKVEADCSFGQLILLIPKRFRIDLSSDTTFARILIQGEPDSVPQGILRLEADASFGQIQVQYI